METLSLLDQILGDWKLLSFAFILGTFWYQGRAWFHKITQLLENTGRVHGDQNASLDSIHVKLDTLVKRVAKIEGTVDIMKIENNNQEVKIAVLEAQNNVIDHPVRRRVRKSQ